VKTTGKRPRDAFTEMLTSVSTKFRTSDAQLAVVTSLSSFEEVRCSLNRLRMSSCIPVPDPYSIPDELRITQRGRNLVDGDVNKNERFLLYSGQQGRLLIFCANTELASIYKSYYLICDGTFEMSPDKSYQLYTIHGYVRDEGMALLWAILPNKTKDTYTELFSALRDALVSTFGNTGHHMFLTDFEQAAISAIEGTFICRVKGCSFHFRQAIIRKVNNEGLKQVYEGDNYPYIRTWIRQIMALILLPEFAVPLIWEVLKHPPATGLPEIDMKTAAFATYVENTWISTDSCRCTFPQSLWSHFDHEGPRTTNLAEGWHNSLNSRFGMPHPSMRNFLNWLQKYQFEVQIREIQLAAGSSPKARDKKYVKLDRDIAAAKHAYGLEIANIFAYEFPSECATMHFRLCTLQYLSHIAYFIVGGH